MKKYSFTSVLALSALLSAPAFAETIDFGGRPERFKGRGDRVPPTCQITTPSAAGSDFPVEWNCEDEDTAYQDIRSELWILRKGAPAWELVKTFLGFPAGISISPEILKTASVVEGLPASFRMVGIDRAGNTTFSPTMTVNPGQAEIMNCSLSVTLGGTETSESGETTGVPVQTVSLVDVSTDASSTSEGAFTLKSAVNGVASPCEIDSICEADSVVSFSGSGTFDDSAASIELSITPGAVSGSLAGTITTSSATGAVSTVSATGSALIEDQSATISLECVSTAGTGDTTSESEVVTDESGITSSELVVEEIPGLE